MSTENATSVSRKSIRKFTMEESFYLSKESRNLGHYAKNKWHDLLFSFQEKFGTVENLTVAVLKKRVHRICNQRENAAPPAPNVIISNSHRGKNVACNPCRQVKRRCDGHHDECHKSDTYKRSRSGNGPLDLFIRASNTFNSN